MRTIDNYLYIGSFIIYGLLGYATKDTVPIICYTCIGTSIVLGCSYFNELFKKN